MYGAKIDIQTKRQGLIFPDRSSVISIQCCVSSQSIELMFDKHSQQTGFFEWNRCIKESEEILDINHSKFKKSHEDASGKG